MPRVPLRPRAPAAFASALLLLAFIAPSVPADPRPPDALDAGELRVALRKLQVMGSVLYIGAHPDDDNTTLLACLARGRLVRTAYLSLTRGDGGQNILGAETGERLGVIRTQELLASRRLDGAEQFFTRALDFGFSKSPEEALRFWGHDRVLADIVWVIRRFRPDVILTRFGTDGSGGHGHHTASAILAGEAFRAAADPKKFPEQLALAPAWQAKRLLWNTWDPKLEGRESGRPPVITLEAGGYDPELGLSYPEIGGRARSLNRSQGAGTPEGRAPRLEYFEPVDGVPSKSDLFDGVDLTWARVKGGAAIGNLLRDAEKQFDPDHPAAILPLLARAHAAMAPLAADPLVAAKRRELEGVMRSAAGLWIEAIAETPTVSPGDTVRVTVTAVDRTAAKVTLEDIVLAGATPIWFAAPAPPRPTGSATAPPRRPEPDTTARVGAAPRALEPGRPLIAIARLVVAKNAPYSQPEWLLEPPLEGSFELPDSTRSADPEGPAAALARVRVRLAGEPVEFRVPVAYRWTDRVVGDRYRALEVLPPVTSAFDRDVYLFPDLKPREVRVALQSTRRALDLTARLRVPPGWSVDPAEAHVRLAAGAEEIVSFRVTPAAAPDGAALAAEVETGGQVYDRSLVRIDYPHIPIQTLTPPAAARAVRTNLQKSGDAIGYLMGSGDEIPEALEQMGFHVTELTDDDVENADLSRFSAIVAGVRAYNTRPRLRVLEPRLLDYVKRGGRLVVQYVTPDTTLNDRLGPWPFKISRDRVTDERAEMRVLDPDHPLLTTPNRIAPGDFDGWVQERGLSYAGPWDSRYDILLSANDPGEPAKDGGVIFTRYGQGVFIYTGLAWFRQLPAGVPGAWRLFANLVSASR